MRAFTVVEPSRAEIRDVPMPEPRADEVLVQVAFCGICGTDYHIFQGHFLSPYPLITGHEFSGSVAALGPGVQGWEVGARVAVDPSIFCSACYHCRSRQWNHCDNWGAIGDTRNGAFAEYVAVPAKNLYRVPDHLSLQEAAMTEPLACVMWGLERMQVRPAARALIFGAGPIGGLMVQALATSTTSDVVVVDVMEEKLAIARELGATATFVNGPGLPEQLKERSQGRGFDVVVDVTGVPTVIEAMFDYAGKRATIMQFGVAPPEARVKVSPFDIYHNDWRILGAMAVNYTMQAAMDLLASGKIRVKPLITRVASLDEMLEILPRPKTAAELKTLVEPARARAGLDGAAMGAAVRAAS